jgi:hypothetical protein
MIPEINRPKPDITTQPLPGQPLPASSDQKSLNDLTAIFHKTLPKDERGLMRQISRHPQPNIVAKLVRWLDHNGILTKETTQAALDHKNAQILLSLTELISDTESLKETEFMSAATTRPYTIAAYLKLLEKANIPKKNYLSFEDTDLNLILRKRVMSVLQKEGNLTEEKLKSLIQVEKIFKDTKRLTKADLLQAMEHAKPEDYAEALMMLDINRIPSEDFQAFTFSHQLPKNYVLALVILQDRGLLTTQIAKTVSLHENPFEFVKGIIRLSQHGNLTETNIVRMLTHVNPDHYAAAFTVLDKTGTYTREDYKLIQDAEMPLELLKGWNILRSNYISTVENRMYVADYRGNYESMAKGLGILHFSYILNEENLELLYDSLEPLITAEALSCLDNLGLLTESNREFLFGTDPQVCEAIKALSNAKILDEEVLLWLLSGEISRAQAVLFIGRHNFLNAGNLRAIRNHEVVEAIISLSNAKLLDQEALEWLFLGEDIISHAQAVLIMKDNLLESNFRAMRNHKDPLSFAKEMKGVS